MPINTAPAGDNRHEGILMVRGRGTGFVTLPGFEEDIVIPRENLSAALDGDIVEVKIGAKIEGRTNGSVVRVIDRKRNEFIGTVHEEKGIRFVKPDSRRIHVRFILSNVSPEVVGQKVAVKIASWKENEEPQGEIIEVFGKAGDHETEIQAIIRSGGFAVGFPKLVEEEAIAIHKNQDADFAEALKDPKRRDMRSITTFTIDPVDAKDFDDALSFEKLPNGNYEIGVHIADVSHYVIPGHPIDKEAQERGTSIYLVDRVIPMLPEILSNDLCSLRPNEDRLAFSAVFEIDPQSNVVARWFGQTVIHSNKRFSYEEAQEVLDKKDGPHLAELETLMDLSRLIRAQRQREGAIAFDSEEVKFELDENKKPIRAYVKKRTETMLMIEDFMLLANREVAEHIYNLSKEKNRDLAFVYRIHDLPDPERIEELGIFLRALGYEFKTNKGVVEGVDINKLLKQIEGKPEANLIKTATIRSMAKAVYSTKNIGHFGLAFKFYTHFTSPIRRYPDLMVHRLLRKHLDGAKISPQEHAEYERLSVQSSQREVGAVEAERDSIKFKQVEYLKDRIGEEFDGVITGVTEWGLYVEEKTSKAEGMVRLSSMKEDYYSVDPKNYRVVGEKKKKAYALGDTVRVKLTGASLEDRTLDFIFV